MSTEAKLTGEPVTLDYEFSDPTPNTVGRQALVSHDGCVVHLERNANPRLLWYGEDLLDVNLPEGTREVCPNPTIPGLPDRIRPSTMRSNIRNRWIRWSHYSGRE